MKTLVLFSAFLGYCSVLTQSHVAALVEIDGFTEDFLSKLDELQQDVLLPAEGLFVLLSDCSNATAMNDRDALKLKNLFRKFNGTEGVRSLVASMQGILGDLVSDSFRDCMAESINDVLEKCAKLVCVTASEEEDLKGGFHNYLWSLALKRSRFLDNLKRLGPQRGFNFVMCAIDPLVRSVDDA